MNTKRLIAAALFLAAVIVAVTLIFASNTKPAQGMQPEDVYASPPQSTKTPKIDKHVDDEFLVLVNWDHPVEKEPKDLVYLSKVIDESYVVFSDRTDKIHPTAGKAANKLFQAAHQNGLRLRIDNAYRSIREQTYLWEYRIQSDPNYGSDPYNNPVKVMPGNKSEHTTGLAIDIFSVHGSSADSSFGETKAGKWLKNNAYKYGFILRYSADKQNITGVVYEPWHFRYVGVEAAKEMYQNNWCLEEYIEQLKD